MTGSLNFELGILMFISQLKFIEADLFQTLRLLDIIFEMKGSLKNKPGISIFSSHLKFPEEFLI